jgi:hypothetical protein
MEESITLPSKESIASVADVKAALGTKKFKQLKTYTEQFAHGEMSPKSFVDSAASLFDNGNDDDFWSFVPQLIDSCPNEYTAALAASYLDSLRLGRHQKLRNGAMSASSNRTTPAHTQRTQMKYEKPKNAWCGNAK